MQQIGKLKIDNKKISRTQKKEFLAPIIYLMIKLGIKLYLKGLIIILVGS
jgi:hypothetical protein